VESGLAYSLVGPSVLGPVQNHSYNIEECIGSGTGVWNPPRASVVHTGSPMTRAVACSLWLSQPDLLRGYTFSEPDRRGRSMWCQEGR